MAMRDLEESGKPLRETRRRLGIPGYDPLDDALSRLAEQEREQIAQIVRREIRKIPEAADSSN
jgi:hypothetical protein